MADVDDELLALAGGDFGPSASDRKKEKKNGSSGKKKSQAADSDMDEGSSDEDGQAEANGSDMDEGDSDDERSAAAEPFPYLGLYKDADDQDYIEGLPELEREEILASRRDEKVKREQKRSLLAMFQTQQGTSAPTSKPGKQRSKPSKPKKSSPSKQARKRRAADSDDDGPPDFDSESEDSEEKVSDYEADHKLKRSKRKRSAVGVSATKRDKLKELSAKRKAKAAGTRRRGSSSDEEEGLRRRRGGDSDYYTDSDESDAGKHRNSRRAKGRYGEEESEREESEHEPPLPDLQATQLNRNTIIKIMHRPDWEKVLTHTFVRFSWGPRKDANGRTSIGPDGRPEELFRIHEIETTTRTDDKWYSMEEGKATNVYMRFHMFGKPHTVDMRSISNQPFTEPEYKRWVAAQKADKRPFPTKSTLERKRIALREYLDKPLTNDDIKHILQQKKENWDAYKVRRGTVDTSYKSNMRATESNLDSDGMIKIDQAATAAMNEKHRKADRQRILDAEKRRAAAKRAAMGMSTPNSQGPPAGGTPVVFGSGNATPGSQTGRSLSAPLGSQGESGSSLQNNATDAAVVASKLEAIGKGDLASSVLMQVDLDLGDF